LKKYVAIIPKCAEYLINHSNTNANQADTADHPKNVWALPPTLRLGEQDKEKYLALGKSDQMTVKFIKDDVHNNYKRRPKWFLAVLSMGWLIATSSATGTTAAQYSVPIGVFSQETQTPPEPWRMVSFDADIPATRYRIIRWDKVIAIEAKAEASMALLARPLNLNLVNTPVLCWRWRVDAPLKSADMAHKSGDDYAARVYVAFDLPNSEMDWTTLLKLRLARQIFGEQVPDAALNYVWDNRYPIGTERPNAYTELTQMLVLQSGSDNAGQWMVERRNVLADAEQAFGKLDFKAKQLAVASDTDNTGEIAHAGFADLHFVGADAACDFPPVND
jgi:hypothetical protein